MAKLHFEENQPPTEIADINVLAEILDEIAAKSIKRFNLVVLEISNGNSLGIVLGSRETALSFTYGHSNPPYYASKGKSKEIEPLLTCYLYNRHHTEFPRRHVISIDDGINATKQFFNLGQLPTCIAWEEV